MTDIRRSPNSASGRVAEVVTAVLGAVLIAGALAATEGWFDRHFLPSFFLPRRWYVAILMSARVAMAALGLLMIAVRPRIGSLVARAPTLSVQIVMAAVLALAASELVLRSTHLRPAEWLMPEEEPRRQADQRLGWT